MNRLRSFRTVLSLAAGLTLLLAAGIIASGIEGQAKHAKTAAAADKQKAAGASGKETAAPTGIKARKVDRVGDRVLASGDVEISSGADVLMADYVDYNLKTGDALAEGNVVMISGGQVIRADRARLNLMTGTGSLENASGLMPPSFIFEAGRLDKDPSKRLGMERARFTLCTQAVPRWSFAVRDATLRNDGQLVMHRVVFRIKDVPVFYLPYLRYPVDKDRATGFLMPRFGTAGSKGLFLSESFYLAIAPNMDATLGLELYSAKGIAGALEYRYLFSGASGLLSVYQFAGRKTEASDVRHATVIKLSHRQTLPWGFNLSADVDYQTSFTFLQGYDDDYRRSVMASRSWQVVLTRSWSNYNFSARVSRYETYYSELADTLVSTNRPQLSFNIFKLRLFSPLYFNLSSSYNNYEYGWTEGTAGTMHSLAVLSLSPSISMPLNSIPWLDATFTFGGSLTNYSKSVDPETELLTARSLTTALYTFRIDLTGPIFCRVYYDREGRPKFKHIIEPVFQYAYDSPISDFDRIYSSTVFSRLNQLTYGLNNRFLVDRDGQAKEILSLGVSQTRYFSPATGPLRYYTVNGEPPALSEVSAFLRYYPTDTLFFDATAGYNSYTRRFSSFRLSGGLGSKENGNFVTLNWLRSDNAWIANIDPALVALTNRHEVSVYSGLKVKPLALDLQGDVAYDILDGRLRYTGGRVVYHYQCVDFMLDYGIYHYLTTWDTRVKFSIGLNSIGRAAEYLSGIGF